MVCSSGPRAPRPRSLWVSYGHQPPITHLRHAKLLILINMQAVIGHKEALLIAEGKSPLRAKVVTISDDDDNNKRGTLKALS